MTTKTFTLLDMSMLIIKNLKHDFKVAITRGDIDIAQYIEHTLEQADDAIQNGDTALKVPLIYEILVDMMDDGILGDMMRNSIRTHALDLIDQIEDYVVLDEHRIVQEINRKLFSLQELDEHIDGYSLQTLIDTKLIV